MAPVHWRWSTLSTVSTIVVLVAWALSRYFYWSKRAQDHPLDRLAQGFRWAGIAIGLLLYWIELKSRSYQPWFPYVVLLTTLFVLILLLVPDASFYAAQAYIRWTERKRQP